MAAGERGREGAFLEAATELSWAAILGQVAVLHLVAHFLPPLVPCFYDGIVLLSLCLALSGNWVANKFMKQTN